MKTFFLQNKFKPKIVLPIEKLAKSQKNRFSGENFLSVHFLLRSKVHFWKLVQKDGFFDTPFDLYKEKKFSSHRSVNVYFLWIKKSKTQNSVFVKRFFLLDFHRPSQIFQPDIWAAKSLVRTARTGTKNNANMYLLSFLIHSLPFENGHTKYCAQKPTPSRKTKSLVWGPGVDKASPCRKQGIL